MRIKISFAFKLISQTILPFIKEEHLGEFTVLPGTMKVLSARSDFPCFLFYVPLHDLAANSIFSRSYCCASAVCTVVRKLLIYVSSMLRLILLTDS